QIQQRQLTVVGEQLGQHPPDRRTPLRFGDPLDDGVVDDLLDTSKAKQHWKASKLDLSPIHDDVETAFMLARSSAQLPPALICSAWQTRVGR
uniref:hypothetical protein n=1 Tax=Nocardia cyriacigeorgica TaxID=135487 RepID=UPI002456FC98